MEIRKRLDPKIIFVGLYVLCFSFYLAFGLRPVEATNYEISAELTIPSIDLLSDVTTLKMKDGILTTPETIVGSFSRRENKTLLIGHSSTVFKKLDEVNTGDEITFDEDTYIIYSKEIVAKEEIDMSELLSAAEKKTLVIMTCAGEDLGNGDATHRLIITAAI